jgi:DNA-binding NarL/FixJ family response regulator
MGGARTVLIVDDHPLFRDALEAALTSAVTVPLDIRQAPTLARGLEMAGAEVDLVLLDLQLEDASGLDGLQRMRATHPERAVAVVSATTSSVTVAAVRALGAVGYLHKNASPAELTAALAALLEGEVVFPNVDSDAVPAAVQRLAELTPAQRRVLAGLAEGLLNKQIAYEMGISDATVKAHMTAIMRKLGVTNRTQALLVYREAVAAGTD